MLRGAVAGNGGPGSASSHPWFTSLHLPLPQARARRRAWTARPCCCSGTATRSMPSRPGVFMRRPVCSRTHISTTLHGCCCMIGWQRNAWKIPLPPSPLSHPKVPRRGRLQRGLHSCKVHPGLLHRCVRGREKEREHGTGRSLQSSEHCTTGVWLSQAAHEPSICTAHGPAAPACLPVPAAATLILPSLRRLTPRRRVPRHRQPVQPQGRQHRQLVPQQHGAAHADPRVHLPPAGDLPGAPGRECHLGGRQR